MSELLKGETIIYFGPEPWAGLWRNRHQLMSRFASQNDVWYVEPPVTLRQSSTGKRGGSLITRDASGVSVFHSPWWLPLIGRAPLKKISIWLFLKGLAITARLRNSRRPIIWLSRPDMIDFAGKLNARLTVYHVVDEYSGYGSPPKEIRTGLIRKEDEMLCKADLVIVVTPTLLALKSPHNKNTHLIPNAVDFAAYANCKSPVPEDMLNIPGPIVGYSGLIAARLDLELLQAVAEARSNWAFVFVGTVNDERCQVQIGKLRDLPNVYFLGQKPAHEMPRYVNGFDVCMIPYAMDLRAQHASPLKLYEYAAASKPIVTTDFAAARDFGGHLRIARNKDEFLSACEQALQSDPSCPDIVQTRQFAASNTWDQRIEDLSGLINSHIDSSVDRKGTESKLNR